MLLNQLNNKIMDLSGPFSNAARNIEQQIKKTEQLSKDIAIRQEKNVGINRNL